jgi:hypothetical protein
MKGRGPSKEARTKYSRKARRTLQQNGALVRSLIAPDQASESDTVPPLSIRKTVNAKNWRVASADKRASTNTAETSSASQREAAEKSTVSVGSQRVHYGEHEATRTSALPAKQKRVNVKTLLEVRIPAHEPTNNSIGRSKVKTLLEVRIPVRKLAKDTIRK